MKVRQYFSGHGMVGVVLFVIGHIASAWMVISWQWNNPSAGALIFGGIVGFATLCSYPLMLIGREYEVIGSPPK